MCVFIIYLLSFFERKWIHMVCKLNQTQLYTVGSFLPPGSHQPSPQPLPLSVASFLPRCVICFHNQFFLSVPSSFLQIHNDVFTLQVCHIDHVYFILFDPGLSRFLPFLKRVFPTMLSDEQSGCCVSLKRCQHLSNPQRWHILYIKTICITRLQGDTFLWKQQQNLL